MLRGRQPDMRDKLLKVITLRVLIVPIWMKGVDMADESLRNLVEQQIGAVSLGVYEGVTTGFSNARGGWSRLDEPQHRWLLSMTARARMRDVWERRIPALGWSVAGNAALMGQTILVSPDARVTLRLLKEHPGVHPGGVPAAGHSKARQLAWAQEPLPGLSLTLTPEVVARTTECLLLWNCEWEQGVPALSARVVHTTGPGRYGVRVPIDLSYEIRPSGNMYDQLKFTGDAQVEDLFPNINQKDNEGDASGQ